MRTASESFVDASGEVPSGEGYVFRREGRQLAAEQGGGLTLDAAPDPVVGFGAAGDDTATKLHTFEVRTGLQSDAVPATGGVFRRSEAFIWCKQFPCPLGVTRRTFEQTPASSGFRLK